MSGRGAVLIVDDEPYVRESLASVFTRRGYEVRSAEGPEEAFATADLASLDAVITDLKMKGEDGLALLRRVAELAPGLPVVVLTGFGTVPSAVECMQAGAADYLLKPAAPEHLLLVVERAIRHRRQERELSYLRRTGEPDRRDPIGESPAWRAAMELIEVVAPSDTPVLLLGESGTGKEEVAKLIHRRSPRAEAALVSVNCAAIPDELFESELFGHRRGAFTGATRDHEGRFRVADGGTLFLDEINSLPAAAQAKLLRVLEDGAFERVGDSRTTRVDVRLICASNSDLPAEVEAGRFRADLFYRINVMTVSLPPLRERREDVALLTAAFLDEIGARLGRRLVGVDAEAEAALRAYDWPGNVRELRNVVERALLLERGDTLSRRSLPFGGATATSRDEGGRVDSLNLRETVTRTERETLREALRRAEGVKRRAAELLGIDERNLAYYLRKHGLMKGGGS